MLGLLNYITWDVSPFIYEGEHFAIQWYGTLVIVGLMLILCLLLVTYKRDNVPANYAWITFLAWGAGMFFMAHLFQGLFYEWYYSPDNPWYFLGIDWDYRNHYFDHPWRFLDIAHGGFSSHGLYLYILILSPLLAKLFETDKWFVSDRLFIGVFILGVLVRLGNFLNAEIYGIPTTLPWGVLFPEESLPSHPTQIYECLIFASAGLLGMWLLRGDTRKYNGLISGILLVYTSILRIAVEFIKLPNMAIEQNWFLNMGQILSIPFFLFGVWLLCEANKESKTNK